jgi:putative salt-induced outer membrane protein YdiY
MSGRSSFWGSVNPRIDGHSGNGDAAPLALKSNFTTAQTRLSDWWSTFPKRKRSHKNKIDRMRGIGRE